MLHLLVTPRAQRGPCHANCTRLAVNHEQPSQHPARQGLPSTQRVRSELAIDAVIASTFPLLKVTNFILFDFRAQIRQFEEGIGADESHPITDGVCGCQFCRPTSGCFECRWCSFLIRAAESGESHVAFSALNLAQTPALTAAPRHEERDSL